LQHFDSGRQSGGVGRDVTSATGRSAARKALDAARAANVTEQEELARRRALSLEEEMQFESAAEGAEYIEEAGGGGSPPSREQRSSSARRSPTPPPRQRSRSRSPSPAAVNPVLRRDYDAALSRWRKGVGGAGCPPRRSRPAHRHLNLVPLRLA